MHIFRFSYWLFCLFLLPTGRRRDVVVVKAQWRSRKVDAAILRAISSLAWNKLSSLKKVTCSNFRR